MDCDNPTMKLFRNCSVTFNQSNQFLNNSASHDGGALLYLATPDPLSILQADTTTFFSNNSAGVYAPDYASAPAILRLIFLTNNDYLVPQQADRILTTNDL